MTRVFAIAKESRACAGHGYYYTQVAIEKTGAYGSDEFPPVFTSREAAEKWLVDNERRFYGTTKIVELILVGP